MGKSMKLYFVITAALSQIGHFSGSLLSGTKSVTPIYLCFLILREAFPGAKLKNFQCGKILARTSLNGLLSDG